MSDGRPTKEQVTTYLVSKGYVYFSGGMEWASWGKPSGEEIDVPIGEQARADYWLMFIRDLARIESKQVADIIDELSATAPIGAGSVLPAFEGSDILPDKTP